MMQKQFCSLVFLSCGCRSGCAANKMKWGAGLFVLMSVLLASMAAALAQNNAQADTLSALSVQHDSLLSSRLKTIDSRTGAGFELSPAQPNIFYAATGNRGAIRGKLLTLNLQTGAGALVGATGLNAVPALAVDSKGNLYAMDGQSADLYRIDAKTGEAISTVSTGITGFRALAFDSSDVLYGVSGSTLYSIDPQDGSTTLIGTIGDFFEGLAFDPIDGTLWASRVGRFQNTDGIYIVDSHTAQTTLIGLTGFGGSTADLHFDAEGNLYAIKGGSRAENVLIIIDRANGKGQLVGQTGFADITGLTLFPRRPTGGHINVNTTAFDAGIVVIDSSRVFGSLIIRSAGTENLMMTGIALPTGPFRLQNLPELPLTLTPGEADTIEVVFVPDTAGAVTSTLTITSNDPDDGVKEVVLSGEGFSLNPAETGKIYAAALGFGTAGSLLELDPATGAGTLIGRTEVSSMPVDLAIDSRGIIWGLSSRDRSLYFIDAATGAAGLAVETNLSGLLAMAFDENDVLYAASSHGLYTIDTNTGASNFIASVASFADLAFDPIDGSLWGVGDGVYRLDPRTGASSLIGHVRPNTNVTALHFDSQGNLFGIISSFSSRQDSLILIDKSDGSATVIGSTGFRDITGLVLHPQMLEGKQLGVSLSAVNFGAVLVGDTVLMPLTLRNIGAEAITISDISPAQAPFSLRNSPILPLTLSPGASHRLRLLFSPDEGGMASDTLTIRSDAANAPVRKIALRGEGFVIHTAALDLFYASTSGTGARNAAFLTIDPATGVGTHTGFTGTQDLPGLAVNSEGFIYGIEWRSGDIYRIDAATGAAFFVASTELSDWKAIAFDENDMLLAARFNILYIIDVIAGTTTRVGSIPVSGSVHGLAFDPIDGALWASVGGLGAGDDNIYVIDPATAAATLIGKTGFKVATSDIHFDSEGNLFGVVNGRVSFGRSEFIAINRKNAKGRVIGEIGVSNVGGLAFYTRKLTGSQLAIRPFLQLDIGNVLVDSISGGKTITLQSIGNEDLAITAISLPAGPFSLAGIPALPAILPPDSSLTLEVVFSPADTGKQTVKISISSNDADTPEREHNFVAKGIQTNRAAPGAFYAAVGDQSGSSGMLITVNPANGAGTFVVPSGLLGIEGLAINSQGLLIGLDSRSRDLYYLDAVTGEAILALSLDRPYLASIAFAANDTLYGFDRDSLYTIDLKSGTSTAVRANGRSYHGMAFDPTDGTLWAVIRNEIYKINLKTGGEFVIGSAASRNDIADLLFDSEGRLFGVQRLGPSFGRQFCYLLAFDKTTGKDTAIGKIGFHGIRGFAFAPVDTTTTAVAESGDAAIPKRFALAQNYPNPFNPGTTIRYAVAERSYVHLQIFNILGQVVRTLIDKQQPPGVYKVTWDARNGAGILQASGLYIVRLRAGGHTLARRMLLLK